MLGNLFQPSSVAVIGASRKDGHVGREILINLLEDFKGNIFPVNPNAESIEGKKCYDNISQISVPIDLAVIAVPAIIAPSVLEDCSASNVRNAVVVSGGFKEIGGHGEKLESELAGIARREKINLIGPNSIGFISTGSRLNASFVQNMALPGNISFLSQSGAFCTAVLDWSNDEGIGFNHFVSLGNKAVLDEVDLIREWSRDKGTDVILGYTEGIDRGKEFIDVTREVTRDIPIVIVKAGRSSEGANAAASHTGTMAGSEEAYEAAFSQSGVIRAENVQELFDFGSILSRQEPTENVNVGILTNAGGPGVMATDALSACGLELAKLENSTIQELHKILPTLASRNNPIDLSGKSDEKTYGEALNLLARDKNVGSLVALSAPAATANYHKLSEIIAKTKRDSDKPIISALMGGKLKDEVRDNLDAASVPNYFDPTRAVKALSVLVEYGKIRDREDTYRKDISAPKERANQILAKAEKSSCGVIGLDGMDILDLYGIPTVKTELARSESQAEELARQYEDPVALKIDSPEIIHKSDVGGVSLEVKQDDASKEFRAMVDRLGNELTEVAINGVRIQKTVEGKEVIVGMKRDPQFGPVLMFGMGGVYVEVLNDVSFGVAPFSTTRAREMVESIDAFPILNGIRGEPGVDLKTLIDILLGVGRLSSDFPEILELDLNPVIASRDGAYVTDVRIKIDGSTGGRG